MGVRFYRRFSVLPGVRLNVSKANVSVSLGRRGLNITKGTSGERLSLGIPGTGLSWTRQRRLSAAGRRSRLTSLKTILVRAAIVGLLLLAGAGIAFRF